MTTKRTTHRSSAGRKLYAVRKAGKFKDVQSYKRAHGQDVRRKSKKEATLTMWMVGPTIHPSGLGALLFYNRAGARKAMPKGTSITRVKVVAA